MSTTEHLDKFYDFYEDKGQAIIDGKSHYPHFLSIHIQREFALETVIRLLQQIEHGRHDKREYIEITLAGSLEPRDDDS